MAEISMELMHEIMKDIRASQRLTEERFEETRSDSLAQRTMMQSLRQEMLAIHQSMNGIYLSLTRIGRDVKTIQSRLELADAPSSHIDPPNGTPSGVVS